MGQARRLPFSRTSGANGFIRTREDSRSAKSTIDLASAPCTVQRVISGGQNIRG